MTFGSVRIDRVVRAYPGSELAVQRRNLGRFAILAAAGALVVYAVASGLAGGYRSSDWPNAMILSRLLWADPAHLYDHASQVRTQLAILGPGGFPHQPGGVLRLSSPPWLGLFTTPFALAGVSWGGVLWALFQLSCLVAGLALMAERKTDALYAAIGIPAWVMVANANAVGLVMLGLGLSWRLRDRHPWLAGLALGLALVRPNVLIPLPFAFVLTRQWRLLGGSVLAAAALVGFAELRQPGLTESWIAAVLGQAGHIGADLSPAGLGWVLGAHLGWFFSLAGLALGLYLSRGRGPGLFPAGLLASPHALVQSLLLVSGGMVAGRRCRVVEVLALNAGAVALILAAHTPLLEALLGSVLLAGFAIRLRTTGALPVLFSQAFPEPTRGSLAASRSSGIANA